jgi:hypothetical protein
MKVLPLIACMICLSIYGMAQCNSNLVVHSKSGTPIKVYVDGSTGRNPATPGVTVNGVTPGEHLLKVVSVYTDDYGYTKRHSIFSGYINVRPGKNMDAWVDEGKGVAIHDTPLPCDGENPDAGQPVPNADNDQNNSQPNNSQPNGSQQMNESQSTPPANSSAPAANTFAAPTQDGSVANTQEKGNEYRPSTTEHLPAHISDDDFEQLKASLIAVQYETKRMDTIKTLVAGKRFATSQVSQLMDLFTFESNKLDVAKLLYDRTVDKYNYGRLASNFNFDARKEDFKKFMAGK